MTIRSKRAVRAVSIGATAFAMAGMALSLFATLPARAEEKPFWMQGAPDKLNDAATKLAPVPAFPVPTPADKLPIDKIKLPPGFKAEVYLSGILDPREMRLGDKGTLFVSSLFVAGKIYAVVEKDGKRVIKTIASGLTMPNGLVFHKGALYVAEQLQITRYDDIESHLDNPPKPALVYNDFDVKEGIDHSWKYIATGPDDKLYVTVGAPCNVCALDAGHGQIRRLNFDGTGAEVVVTGVRSSYGLDWDPKTKDLWFTENARDWLSEDSPADKLNHVTKAGQNFGFPYCHQGDLPDPEFGWGHACSEFTAPASLLGAHAAPLSLRFYTGKMFPKEYQGAIFIARHGPWNRTKKYAADIEVAELNADGSVKSVKPFLTGLIDEQNNKYLGRLVDVMVMNDGSLLVSDDHNGAIYRITYSGK
jgi:glucose/arabinose dehydrogenase